MAKDSLKTLETLTRLAEKKVEEQQKEIAALQRVIDDMKARKRHLLSSIDAGYATANVSSDIEVIQMSGNFHKRAKAELLDIAEAMTDAERIMAEKRNVLQTLFAEQKRYEILHKRRTEEGRKAALKKEQKNMDELGGQKKTL